MSAELNKVRMKSLSIPVVSAKKRKSYAVVHSFHRLMAEMNECQAVKVIKTIRRFSFDEDDQKS